MEKNTFAKLLRKLYSLKKSGGELNNDEYKSLYNQLINLCRTYLPSYTTKDRYSEFANEVYIRISDSMRNSNITFWKEREEDSEDNDKLIIAYIFQMLSEQKRISQERASGGESTRLYKIVKEVLKELFSQGAIEINDVNRESYYSIKSVAAKKTYDGYEIYSSFCSLRKKESSIDNKKVKDYILDLMTEMENYKFTISDICRIITENTDIGNYMLINEDTDNNYDTAEKASPGLELREENYSTPEINIIVESIWNEVKKYYYSDEELRRAAEIFYLKAGCDLTLREIVEVLDGKYKKSSIDNYFKDFINAINFPFFTNETTFKPVFHELVKLVENTYKFYDRAFYE